MSDKRTADDWKALIEKYDGKGEQSQKEFCEAEGIQYHNLTYWRKKLGMQVRQSASKGGDAGRLPAAAGAALNVASILAESKRQLNEGRKELEKRKAALLAQVEEIDLEVMQIDEALAKLG